MGRIREAILADAPDAFASDDLLRFANALPRMLYVEAVPHWRTTRMREGIGEALGNRIRALYARGCIGLIGIDGIGEALDVAREALPALTRGVRAGDPHAPGIHWVGPWIDEVVLPRLDRLRPVPPEDGLALGALSR